MTTIEIFDDIKKWGKGLWKLNCSFLKDPEFIENVTKIIERGKILYRDNIVAKFDSIKCDIRTYAIGYGARKKREITKNKSDLSEKLLNLEKDNKEFTEEYQKTHQELEKIYDYEAEGQLLRLKIEDTLDTSANKQLINKFKEKGKPNINILTDDNNKDIIEKSEIKNHITNFYKKLYSPKRPKTSRSTISSGS
jgi:hypothetical protein